jgi:hypothetical protein
MRDNEEIKDWVRENQHRFRIKGSFDGYEVWRFDGAVTLSLPGPLNSEAEFVEAVAAQYGTDPDFTALLAEVMDAEVRRPATA